MDIHKARSAKRKGDHKAMNEMKTLKELLTTGKYQGKIDISIQSYTSPIMSRTRLVNPQIEAGEKFATLKTRGDTARAVISFEGVESISTQNYYDGIGYFINYNGGNQLTAIFS